MCHGHSVQHPIRLHKAAQYQSALVPLARPINHDSKLGIRDNFILEPISFSGGFETRFCLGKAAAGRRGAPGKGGIASWHK